MISHFIFLISYIYIMVFSLENESGENDDIRWTTYIMFFVQLKLDVFMYTVHIDLACNVEFCLYLESLWRTPY